MLGWNTYGNQGHKERDGVLQLFEQTMFRGRFRNTLFVAMVAMTEWKSKRVFCSREEMNQCQCF